MTSSIPTDANVEEIDITAEMIAAGTEAFFAFNRSFGPEEEMVQNIYRAMVGVRAATISRKKSSVPAHSQKLIDDVGEPSPA